METLSRAFCVLSEQISVHFAGADTAFFLGLFFEASYASLVRNFELQNASS
jgi:hypothetical protein